MIPCRATYEVLQLVRRVGEGSQIVIGEDVVEALLEGLQLDLHSFMEHVMQCKVYVLLQGIQGHVFGFSICLQFYVIVTWESEDQAEVFEFRARLNSKISQKYCLH